ncbi:hypothetical protein B0I72DRAFT_41909 [Yarrowia lipolytica]|jgi:hypothetical protein|uniref:Uncharacterized protein n=1 Tax=Yarrowia lipolytica TaxID=4952 RepID=A0A1H6Q6T4_YARLL|nr:hypothetical protein YALI1_A07405g [Yarrowia lipolytica]KAB8281760.1 hypothetical protein BKA91DRAFT_28922 [Yarrowia lipolytica]KAE8170397.1 hypothetical protein BKA90DRAFT_36783 [Yarrowia lipolytica]KAJ8051459.1 hypothetical protein LXG23DRAFT_39167 [Yarrowia lipolytica]QNP95116.1 Hypothetical protein YALI2_A00115g [Yarrowia lipolytica]
MMFMSLVSLALLVVAAPVTTSPEAPADQILVVSPADLNVQGTDIVYRPTVGASDPDYRPDLSINVANGRVEIDIAGTPTNATLHTSSNGHFGYAPVGQTALKWSQDGSAATLTYNGSPYFYACVEGSEQYIYVQIPGIAAHCASPQWMKISA